VVPNYDADRVFASDIKKILNWYLLLCSFSPEAFPAEEPKKVEAKEKAEPKEKAAPKEKKVAEKKPAAKKAK
jgi:hypothetical protein